MHVAGLATRRRKILLDLGVTLKAYIADENLGLVQATCVEVPHLQICKNFFAIDAGTYLP